MLKFILLILPVAVFAQAPVFGAPAWKAVSPIPVLSVTLSKQPPIQNQQLLFGRAGEKLKVLPEDYNWRRDVFRTEVARRAAFGFQPSDSRGRTMPIDVMQEVSYRALYSKM